MSAVIQNTALRPVETVYVSTFFYPYPKTVEPEVEVQSQSQSQRVDVILSLEHNLELNTPHEQDGQDRQATEQNR
jgi:hypothetical protein